MQAWEEAFREWKKKLKDAGETCPSFKQAFMEGWRARESDTYRQLPAVPILNP